MNKSCTVKCISHHDLPKHKVLERWIQNFLNCIESWPVCAEGWAVFPGQVVSQALCSTQHSAARQTGLLLSSFAWSPARVFSQEEAWGAWQTLPLPTGVQQSFCHTGPRANTSGCRFWWGCIFVAGFLTGLWLLHMFWVCLVLFFFPAEFY